MYKSLVIAVLILFGTITIFAKGVKPPPAVLAAFQLKFPSAKEVKWEKENGTEYEAEFIMDKGEYSANFKDDGTWLETEMEVDYTTLPDAVRTAFEKQVNKKAKEASKIVKAGDITVYEVEYKKGMKTKELVYNPDGTMAKMGSK